MIRNNYSRYSENISEYLRNIRIKIHDRILTFPTKFPISSTKAQNKDLQMNWLYRSTDNPDGYAYEGALIVGSDLYEIGGTNRRKIRINAKSF